MLTPLLLPLPPHPSSIPYSVVSLQSSLILGGDITEIRQIDSPPFRSFFFSLFLSRLTFLCLFGSQTWNKVAVNRPGSGRFIMMQRHAERGGRRGTRKKRARRGNFVVLVLLLAVAFRKLALFLSPRLFSSDSSLFRPISFLPPAALSLASPSRGGN